MAEESISLLLTPETTRSDGGNSRRNSMGRGSSSNSGIKIVPHYLRASTGSCHDFCKYGRKHAFEEKARHPIPKRNTTKQPNDQNPLPSMVLPERKKMSVVKLKPSPNLKTPKPNTLYIVKPDSFDIIKREVITTPPDGHNSVASELVPEKKTSAVKHRPSSSSKTCLSNAPQLIKNEVSSSSEKIEVSSRHATSKAKGKNLSAKLSKSLELKSSSPDSLGGLGGRRNHDVKIGHRMGISEEMNLSGKRASALKVKPVSPYPSGGSKLKSFSPDPSGGSGGRRNSDINMGQKTGAFKAAAHKALGSPRALLSPKPSVVRVASLTAGKHRNLKAVSSLNNQKKNRKDEPKQPKEELKRQTAKPEQPKKEIKLQKAEPDESSNEKRSSNDIVQEKTLYVIRMESDSKVLQSDLNENLAELSPPSSSPDEEDQGESEYSLTETEDDSLSEYDETVEEAEILEGEGKWRPRKAGMVSPTDKDCQPVKLHFRRGKVVDIQSENNGPRRLRFRRGRVLEESQNIKADGRRSFKRRGVDAETNEGKPGSEKIVLRHQDVQGKKDSQGLFNNVIEETASKLAETRKSKVKALVGAFETVISLQEKNPSANTATGFGSE